KSPQSVNTHAALFADAKLQCPAPFRPARLLLQFRNSRQQFFLSRFGHVHFLRFKIKPARCRPIIPLKAVTEARKQLAHRPPIVSICDKILTTFLQVRDNLLTTHPARGSSISPQRISKVSVPAKSKLARSKG